MAKKKATKRGGKKNTDKLPMPYTAKKLSQR